MTTLLSSARSVCERLTEEIFPEDAVLFNSAWNAIVPLFTRWAEQEPTARSYYILDSSTLQGLGFADALGSAMPVAFSTAFATMLEMWESGVPFIESSIALRVRKYARVFGASQGLQQLLEEKVPAFCLEIYQEMERKGLFTEQAAAARETERGERVKSRKAYARMWTIETRDTELGDPVLKKDFEDKMKNRAEIPLIITKISGITTVYLDGDEAEPQPTNLILELLEYVLKHNGKGGDALNLIEKVWRDQKKVIRLRNQLEEAKGREDEGAIKLKYHAITVYVRGAVHKVNEFLDPIGAKLETKGRKQYKLSKAIQYYLFERI